MTLPHIHAKTNHSIAISKTVFLHWIGMDVNWIAQKSWTKKDSSYILSTINEKLSWNENKNSISKLRQLIESWVSRASQINKVVLIKRQHANASILFLIGLMNIDMFDCAFNWMLLQKHWIRPSIIADIFRSLLSLILYFVHIYVEIYQWSSFLCLLW